MEEREKNPMKELAIHLAHSMDDQKRLWDEPLREHEIEEIRACHSQITNEIWKKGYDIGTMLHLAEEYKTLTWELYRDWVYI